MRINEASARSGLTQDTIRFYEKSGMLAPIRRDARGWRVFNADDVNWLTTLERLRATGMPLDDVKRFALSAHASNREAPEERAKRLALLEKHAITLAHRQAELEACKHFLDHKINIYRTSLEVTHG
ncbi:MerR family transcriptional regulator [Cognatiyoonia sp. IB215182]|uniref:MerR family transcriptional regulator n=1 Tax=Cognatiyoonia sp. IB215182 TaxID=3097353 RepID=UPI002A0F3365|nr:MerR family transcriptional regulator [Cognatiyoonia sp. IB215182]MDX8353269.1 MerR family transcriptional regulator [Cognatiyoonia sp. IB215182]